MKSIETQDFTHRFSAAETVLNRVNLQVEEGTIGFGFADQYAVAFIDLPFSFYDGRLFAVCF